ncbi:MULTISPECIES: hypothetical protein [unclassified Paenibacillus]|uniref:hypothetical protein n=1 Tax=unclassified Paenibacillus TaxID=185978 RepID=UPI002405D10C|nr:MULTISPECIES: hypothetical protein [unclassified Paenibacillus]MDF9839946.1 hypothetical protein [Paenibacillus sp. PastF-2]MDF9846528.1 hypothetical protein [Paenibacillus sp. PastM-2]MDF9853124.1 hypothetical protein [Paenibacillus sp. PastF-1]MDH6478372.1 hypothetical protein [Paenibacillus sp. PastH-2]MDH6506130.1 hypothetical protein [Paenibacillus sp. PastM-3]
MKRKVPIAIIGAYILLVITGVVWHAGGVSAEDTIKLTVNSQITSTTAMNNMQPGDAVSSEYTVINEGSERFDYFVDFEFVSGDAELYDILQMKLQKEGVTLYSGVMSKAEGRVAIGTLPGGGRETIRMDVVFPVEAGNEFQGKAVSVAFNFTASAVPEPTPGPSPSPSASPEPSSTASPAPSASPDPTGGPINTPEATPTATATPTVNPTVSPNPTAAPSQTPDATAYPGGVQTPVPSATPAATPSATPGGSEVTVTTPPVPLGGGDGDNGEAASTPGPGSVDAGSTAAPSPDPEVVIDDDELPLSGPEGGDELPDTSEPWYNLILISMAVTIVSIILLRRLNSKK